MDISEYVNLPPSERLKLAGQLLFGQQWQRDLARALGPHHPRGFRKSIDDRLVRRWIAGDRPVPDWVPKKLMFMIFCREDELRRHRSNLLQYWVDEVNGLVEKARTEEE